MIRLKPKVKRGQNRDSINGGYGIIGFCPNRNMKGISKFVFRHGLNLDTKKEMEERFVKVLNKLHLANDRAVPTICENQIFGYETNH